MKRTVFCGMMLAALVGMTLTGTAGADPTVAWFPYASCHNWPTGGGPTWGGYWGSEVAPAGDTFHDFPVYVWDVNGTWDTNGDGTISFAEAQVAVPGLLQAEFDAADTNRDGRLSREDTKYLHKANPNLNPIWNTYRIWNNYTSLPTPYAPSSTSIYDNGIGTTTTPSQFTWILAIHNPTDTDFTGPSALRIDVYAPNGSLVTDDKSIGNNHWNYNAAENLKLFVNNVTVDANNNPTSVPGPNLTWSTANHCFYASVAAGATLVLGCWGAEGTNNLFSDPTTDSTSRLFKAALKVSQPGGLDFMASIRSLNYGYYRFSTTALSLDKIADIQAGYKGVYVADYPNYPAQNTTIVLPHYRERYDDSNVSTVHEWATLVVLMNADSSDDVVTITAKNTAGTVVSSQQYGLRAHQRIFFAPSQFYPAYNPQSQIIDAQGSLYITGKLPVAEALQIRFPKTSWTATTAKVTGGTLPNPITTQFTQNFRTTAMQTADFFIANN